ncbi:FadR/GntR family transcriptional regulator [Glycomyces algeriensis]|uniref:GntR family transcriptional regulator n=1 Tax=Glycomyces algeriensis TaxID=256037 RepID=A0A9W6GAN8_9ACTN|nr:FCD domain-containing protein [Glycomyces algeriensis]MDA1364626.1 FCD domain-containing protein [Glycomyces algeriensis]MDR7350663.1 DNA-binding FadR family transcriptional regulator [Glycomyces algeriensis]GLI43372.1 GntR family transcriptional regulator [Glycomyces algeriensis]
MARASRTQAVVEQVLDAIIDGKLQPGEPLPPEGVLAEDLHVSRLTLREAVRLLQAQGVIVQVPGRRHRVAPVAQWTGIEAVVRHARSAGERKRSSLELLEVRMMIETGAAQLAAERCSASDLDALRELLGRMKTAHAKGDVVTFVAADLEFHDVILRAADNRILVAALLPLTAMLAETRSETSAVAEIREHAIAEHTAIVAALAAGDRIAARDAMAGHMDQTRVDLLEHVHSRR